MHISYKPLWHTLVERNMRKRTCGLPPVLPQI